MEVFKSNLISGLRNKLVTRKTVFLHFRARKKIKDLQERGSIVDETDFTQSVLSFCTSLH